MLTSQNDKLETEIDKMETDQEAQMDQFRTEQEALSKELKEQLTQAMFESTDLRMKLEAVEEKYAKEQIYADQQKNRLETVAANYAKSDTEKNRVTELMAKTEVKMAEVKEKNKSLEKNIQDQVESRVKHVMIERDDMAEEVKQANEKVSSLDSKIENLKNTLVKKK